VLGESLGQGLLQRRDVGVYRLRLVGRSSVFGLGRIICRAKRGAMILVVFMLLVRRPGPSAIGAGTTPAR
jgi:hypothetical protein